MTGRKVTVLLPTFHRPVKLRRVLDSIVETAPDVRIVVAIEPDDPQAAEIASEYNADIAVCKARRLGCSNAWNEALRLAPDSDIYVIAADDCIFKANWLSASLSALKKLGGSGLVAFRSGRRLEMGDHYMMTRDFIVKYHGGVAAIPHYQSWCVDDEAQLRAKRAGLWALAQDAIVVHDHPKGEIDAGYAMMRERRDDSRKVFYGRMAAGWPDDFEPIITERKDNV